MRVFRRGSLAKRAAISLVATIAFLLQSLLAAPASASRAPDPATCAQPAQPVGSAQEEPTGEHSGGHGLCCILACVACGVAFVASVAGIVDFPERPESRITLARATIGPASAPLEFYFSARGPPTDL
jgi:hypothetical protein